VGKPGSEGTVGGKFFSWMGGSKAAGGLIGDSVPAMLMGGEYVVNRNAVQKYGSDFFSDLNKGKVPRFAEGGYVGGNGVRSDSKEKGSFSNVGLDGETTNNINISVNIEEGRVTSDVATAEGGMSPERARQLGVMIKDQVVNTILQQKRQGGILYSKSTRSVQG